MSSTRRLAHARKLRVRIASELRALAQSRVRIEDVLEDPTDALGRVSVHVVLEHAPGLGREGTKNVCRKAGVWPTDRLASVDETARQRLVRELPQRARRAI